MPKLNKKMAKSVGQTDPNSVGGGFEPLKPGKYVATLLGVVAQTTNAGDPMWVAEFGDLISMATGKRAPGRQWLNMTLPIEGEMPAGYQPRKAGKDPREAWDQRNALSAARLHQFFEAFGYTTDSDTDEMEGERCVLQIGVRTIQQGARQGERTNTVNALEELPEGYTIPQDDDDDTDGGDF